MWKIRTRKECLVSRSSVFKMRFPFFHIWFRSFGFGMERDFNSKSLVFHFWMRLQIARHNKQIIIIQYRRFWEIGNYALHNPSRES